MRHALYVPLTLRPRRSRVPVVLTLALVALAAAALVLSR